MNQRAKSKLPDLVRAALEEFREGKEDGADSQELQEHILYLATKFAHKWNSKDSKLPKEDIKEIVGESLHDFWRALRNTAPPIVPETSGGLLAIIVQRKLSRGRKSTYKHVQNVRTVSSQLLQHNHDAFKRMRSARELLERIHAIQHQLQEFLAHWQEPPGAAHIKAKYRWMLKEIPLMRGRRLELECPPERTLHKIDHAKEVILNALVRAVDTNKPPEQRVEALAQDLYEEGVAQRKHRGGGFAPLTPAILVHKLLVSAKGDQNDD